MIFKCYNSDQYVESFKGLKLNSTYTKTVNTITGVLCKTVTILKCVLPTLKVHFRKYNLSKIGILKFKNKRLVVFTIVTLIQSLSKYLIGENINLSDILLSDYWMALLVFRTFKKVTVERTSDYQTFSLVFILWPGLV